MVQHIYGGKAPTLMGIVWSLALVATILVVLRIYHRASGGSSSSPWPLRWAMFCLAVSTGSTICLTISVSYGMCMHLHELGRDQIRTALEWVWITQAIQIFSYGFGKVVVVSFLLELQAHTHPKGRIFLLFLAVSNVALSLIEPFLVMFQCTPPKKLWEPYLEGSCNFAPPTLLGYFQGGWTAATDFALAIYPSFIIWNLRMARRLKLGLCSLMGLGVLMGACAIAKSIEIGVVERATDQTYELYRLLLWAQTEMWVTLIIPCIPPLWPLFRRIFLGIQHRTTGGSSSASETYNGSSRHREPLFRSPYRATVTASTVNQLESGSGSEQVVTPLQDGIFMTTSISVQAESREKQNNTINEVG